MGGAIDPATFVELCEADDLWVGELRKCDVAGRAVLLANVNGEIRAYADACPHQGVSLSEGEFDGRTLTCRAHRWRFDLGTGRGVNPAGARLSPFPVRIVDGKLLVGDRPIGGEP